MLMNRLYFNDAANLLKLFMW